MSSPLETSVTLEDVLAVVAAKRVPLAAELAGYLALEMAEGAGTNPGALETTNVYVSDEGTVALVRTRKDGDAEESIRAMLAKLLEAGGTQTPALGVAAKKASSGGTATLARELEAALIPVNRAAGRRALARLAREVKRVTLGVGRNASIPPNERTSRGSQPDARRGSQPSVPGFTEDEIPTTAKRNVEPELVAESKPPVPALQRPDSGQLPTVEISRTDAARLRTLPEAVRDSARPPPDAPSDGTASGPKGEPFGLAPSAEPPVVEELLPVDEPPKDDVDELLSNFAVSGTKEDKGLQRELKALVGVDPTPPPLGTTDGHAPDDASVEDLLAMSRESNAPPKVAPEPKKKAPPVAAVATASKKSEASEKRAGAKDDAKDDAAPAKAASHSYADERSMPTAPSARQPAKKSKLGPLDVVLWLFLTALIGAGGYLLLLRFKPDLVGAPPTTKPTAAPPAPTPSAIVPALKPTCKASLMVEGAPDKSEILLRVGQAPVEVDHMPVGTRLEFVATADAHAPKRAIVPAGAAWEKANDGKPRYELAVQLDPSKAKGGVDPWPPAEPGSAAGGEGAPGVVRVVASPKGAEVWLLVGLGPEAVIERLPCSGDVQVLVAGVGNTRKRIVVREADFAASPSGNGVRTAKVSAK